VSKAGKLTKKAQLIFQRARGSKTIALKNLKKKKLNTPLLSQGEPRGHHLPDYVKQNWGVTVTITEKGGRTGKKGRSLGTTKGDKEWRPGVGRCKQESIFGGERKSGEDKGRKREGVGWGGSRKNKFRE